MKNSLFSVWKLVRSWNERRTAAGRSRNATDKIDVVATSWIREHKSSRYVVVRVGSKSKEKERSS